jgi:hypothetical protein
MPKISLGPNPGGIGVYNAEVENYLLQFLLVEKSDKPTTALIHQISMPPVTMEFDRAGSLRRGQLNSADSSDSIDSGVGGDTASVVDGGPHQPQIRGRAATFDVYKIRTRVGSKVSTVTKLTQEVLASKPHQQHQKSKNSSPSKKRLLSTKRRITSSPHMFRIPMRRTSSAEKALDSSASVPTSPNDLALLENGDVVKSKAKENGVCRVGEGEREGEAVDSGVTPVKSRAPRSADSSPQVSPVFSHKIREHSVKRAK